MELCLNERQHVAWLSYLRVFYSRQRGVFFLLKTERGVLKGGGRFSKGWGGVFTQGWGGVGLGFHFTNFYFSGFQ